MVKIIIFDLQGTLVENGVFPSPVKQVRFILGIRESFHDYITEFEKVFMTQKYENLSQGFLAVAEHFNADVPDFVIEKLVGIWNKNKLLSKLYPETLEVLAELKKEYKLVLAANIDCFSKDIIEKYALQEYFDAMYLSCDTGMLKTDKGFFEKILSDLNVEKQDVIVIGDSVESDMKSAESSGINSVLVDRNNRMNYDPKILNLKEIKKDIDKIGKTAL